MVSISPDTQSLNFTHQFDFCHSRPPKPKSRNSLMTLLEVNPVFSSFMNIVKKAGMEEILNDPQTNLTIFVSSDEFLNLPPGYISNMDILTARQIVNAATLNRKIPLSLIKAQPVISLVTKLPTNKLYITTINCQTMINCNTRLLYGDIEVGNGMVHVVDNLLFPISLSTASYYSQTY